MTRNNGAINSHLCSLRWPCHRRLRGSEVRQAKCQQHSANRCTSSSHSADLKSVASIWVKAEKHTQAFCSSFFLFFFCTSVAMSYFYHAAIVHYFCYDECRFTAGRCESTRRLPIGKQKNWWRTKKTRCLQKHHRLMLHIFNCYSNHPCLHGFVLSPWSH